MQLSNRSSAEPCMALQLALNMRRSVMLFVYRQNRLRSLRSSYERLQHHHGFRIAARGEEALVPAFLRSHQLLVGVGFRTWEVMHS